MYMSRYSHALHLLALLSCVLIEANAVDRADFFGELTEDTQKLLPNDDDSSVALTLSVPYPFFDRPMSLLYVNNNGAITFSTQAMMYDATEFPHNRHQLIAPFWGDVDTRGGGTVWYKETTDQALLDNATEYVRLGFVLRQEFRPTHLFIATWDGVGYYMEYNSNSDKNNTFQTILVTDSNDLYVIFLYEDIQWTTGDSDMGEDGLGGVPAQVGFNAGDMENFYLVPGSRTDDILNIDQRSNIGIPGAWVFHVSGPKVKIGGCESQLSLMPSHGSILGGEIVSVTGRCFDPTTRIQCQFDNVVRSAIFVSTREVLCVSPELQHSGQFNFRLLVDGHRVGRQQRFTSIPIEKAYQVNVTTPTDRVSFTGNDMIHLEWLPESIFPISSSSEIQIDIRMYGLNLQNGEWELIHTFVSNSNNDGEEIVRIPQDLNPSLEILPVVFQVSSSANPDATVRSGTLYTKLVESGQSAARWSSQYYYFNPVVATRTSYHLCQSWYEGEVEGSTGVPVLDDLTPCPPQETQARAINSGLIEIDYTSFFGIASYRRQWLQSFHPGASACFTGKLQSSVSSSSQQCCYDDAGRLIINAPGGGSINKVAPATSRVDHFLEDIRPYLLCCTGYALSCHEYYKRRPSDDGQRYRQPPPAWIFGDPHLVTLDGHNYTFNGKGEFTLIQTPTNAFTLQGRFQQFNNVTATVLTAIAAKEQYSDKVMIAQSRRGIDAYVYKARDDDVDVARVDLSMVREQEFRNVTIFRGNDSNSVSVAFAGGELITARAENGFLSAFAVVLPRSFCGTTRGLLGNYDGNSSNDFLSSTGGNPLPTSDTLRRIHELFGSTWILNSIDDSLFMYRPYENFSSVRDPDFNPTFEIDRDSANISICKGDPFCEYDVVTTGDQGVGRTTLSALADIQEAVEKSYPVVCNPPCFNGACVANDTCRCAAGYSGALCNTVPGLRLCDLNPCTNEERCAVVGGSYICTPNCNPGVHSDPLCNVLPPPGPCRVNHCHNRGVCRPNNSTTYGFECLCPPGFTGRLCDLSDNPCATQPCQNGGTCTVMNNNFKCNCPEGYSGDRCEIAGPPVVMIAIAASVGLLVVLIVVVVICILVAIVCNKRSKRDKERNVHTDNKRDTLKSTGTGEGVHQQQNGVASYDDVSLELPRPSSENTYVNHNPGQYSQNHNPGHQQQHNVIGQGSYSQIPGNPGNHNYPHQTPEGHDISPPPPYQQEWHQTNSNQNNSRVTRMSRVQSDSRLPSVTNQGPMSVSDSNSSRCSTTSPTNDKELLEKSESVHIMKNSMMSNRLLLTPSPSGPESGPHSQSHQGIPLRSTASTPSGPVYNATRRNTVPRNWSSQQLSMSASHIPIRRNSSSSSYIATLRNNIDGSEVVTMISEV